MKLKFVLAAVFLGVGVLSCGGGEAATSKPEAEGVRGVWVPAPNFTDVLHTRENVRGFVEDLDELNMNAIFLVSWANTSTVFKSRVLVENSTYATAEQGYMLAAYADGFDPVRLLIDEAHARDIKVFFWFEYGFMGEGRPIAADNPILARNPSWLGVGNDGGPSNYNGSDYYFNAYDPAVQRFMLELVEESLELYPDVDGIQGDDRMPAMPRNSGYDDYTVALYKQQHDGRTPPANIDDAEWVRWRLDILNDFGRRLYATVKAASPDAMVSFAPNPYPWCVEKLMQEWPQWCADGICDLLAVQNYRYTVEAYRSTLTEVMKNRPAGQPVAPGMILSSAQMTPEMLRAQLQINRQFGVAGEVFFYNKALDDPAFRAVLKDVYRDKVKFPALR